MRRFRRRNEAQRGAIAGPMMVLPEGYVPTHHALILSGEFVKLLFVFSLGACVGSLTNVLVYRMPLGLSVVRPASRCPTCSTKLRWNDNIPILGWVFLRGRCRYCRTGISAQYPVVELIGGLLFALPFFLFFTVEQMQLAGIGTHWLGIDFAGIAPEWARAGRGFPHMWPVMLVILVLLGCLLPATIIDARTFMIPLILTWIPSVTAVVVLPVAAAWHGAIAEARGRSWAFADGWTWAIASPGPAGWHWIGGSLGAIIGLGVSLLLVRAGLLRRSFADYAQWEKETFGEGEADQSSGTGGSDSRGALPRWHWPVLVLIVLASGVIGGWGAHLGGQPAIVGVALGLVAGPIIAARVHRLVRARAVTPEQRTSDHQSQDSPAEVWLAYPHARRETVLELAFLGMPALLALAGWVLAPRLAGPWSVDPTTFQHMPTVFAPLWLDVLAGVLMGYLIGGGVVWGVRMLGTLAFGKEAMGMGDVHLMAGVGACLGWIDPTIAFLLAAFVALYLEVVGRIAQGEGRRAMPFGPSLAAATLIVLLGKSGIEEGLNRWLGRTEATDRIDLP